MHASLRMKLLDINRGVVHAEEAVLWELILSTH
jgi:hypothetical protein